MSYWRMSFRCRRDSEVHELWQPCFDKGLASITYHSLKNKNLIQYKKFFRENAGKYPNDWSDLSASQKYSLRTFAFEIKQGDTIFVKKGSLIVCKGIVRTGRYIFDNSARLRCPIDKDVWRHQLLVDWDKRFVPIKIEVGNSQRFTIEALTEEDVNKITSKQKSASKSNKKAFAEEGAEYNAYAKFRKRNREIIEIKKSESNGHCEVCDFNYSHYYKGLFKNHLVAHHLKPIGSRKVPKITKLEDLALLCSNCHTAIHSTNPPMSLNKLRNKIN